MANVVISRCCFAEDSTDLFIRACRTCSTIIFPHSTNQILNLSLSLPFTSLMLKLLFFAERWRNFKCHTKKWKKDWTVSVSQKGIKFRYPAFRQAWHRKRKKHNAPSCSFQVSWRFLRACLQKHQTEKSKRKAAASYITKLLYRQRKRQTPQIKSIIGWKSENSVLYLRHAS